MEVKSLEIFKCPISKVDLRLEKGNSGDDILVSNEKKQYPIIDGIPDFTLRNNKEEEKKNLIEFFNFTQSHFKKYPKSKIYHYGSYEITALLKLTSFHKVKGIEYDHYLNLDKFVNLLEVNRQGLFISEKSYSLKNIEKFYEFKREGDVQRGDASQEYYIEWLETQDQNFLDEI